MYGSRYQASRIRETEAENFPGLYGLPWNIHVLLLWQTFSIVLWLQGWVWRWWSIKSILHWYGLLAYGNQVPRQILRRTTATIRVCSCMFPGSIYLVPFSHCWMQTPFSSKCFTFLISSTLMLWCPCLFTDPVWISSNTYSWDPFRSIRQHKCFGFDSACYSFRRDQWWWNYSIHLRCMWQAAMI